MNRTIYREWRDPHDTPSVHCWWEHSLPSGGGDHVQRVIPDGRADIIVSDRGALFVGPTTVVEMPRLQPGDRLLGLRLHTEAIGPSLRVPASQLRGLTLPLNAVMSDRQARVVADQVASGVVPHLLTQASIDRRVRCVVRLLSRSPATSLVAVADDIGVSPRHLYRLLIEHTGLSPRAVQRIARLHIFVRLAAEAWPRTQLATLAADAGYADQPHLSREVRAMSGTTPSVLLAERLSTRQSGTANETEPAISPPTGARRAI